MTRPLYIFLVICSILLASPLVNAEEVQERAEVGVRTEVFDDDEADQDSCRPEEESLVPQGMGYNLGPGSYHQIIFVPTGVEHVELEDGSIWYLDAHDRKKVLDWFPSDPVYISFNRGWFSNYPFQIVNTETGQRVAAHMQWGPFVTGDVRYTRWIVDIDYGKKIVRLNDATEWTVSSLDGQRLGKWLVDDTVIVGVNEDWTSGWNPNILINVNILTPKKAHKSYVRACSSF